MSTLLDDKNKVAANGRSHHVADKSLSELLGELTGQLVTLGKQELNLAKAELRESAKKSVRDSAGMMVGGLVLHAGLLALCATIAAALDLVMPLWGALLVTSVLLFVIGGVVVKSSLSKLQEDAHLEHLPESLNRNKQFLKEKMA